MIKRSRLVEKILSFLLLSINQSQRNPRWKFSGTINHRLNICEEFQVYNWMIFCVLARKWTLKKGLGDAESARDSSNQSGAHGKFRPKYSIQVL